MRSGQDSHSLINFNSSNEISQNISEPQNQPNENSQNIGGLAANGEDVTSAQNHRDAYNMMRAGHNDDMEKDLIGIFNQQEFSDVTLVVENK